MKRGPSKLEGLVDRRYTDYGRYGHRTQAGSWPLHQGLGRAHRANTPWGSPAAPWRRELERHGLLQRCDATVFCVEVGWRKPHPAPFRRVLELLSVSASRAAFVGDHPQWDILGAEQSGLTPILLSERLPAGVSCRIAPTLDALLDMV